MYPFFCLAEESRALARPTTSLVTILPLRKALNSDYIFSDGEDLGDGDDGLEIEESSEVVSTLCSTAQASRAHIRTLARRGLV